MPQPNLLELAKHGNPDAIAALINLTLQPRGVTATAIKIGDYLHVSFSADRMLNKNTLVSFTRKGLEDLHTDAIHTVKIYAFKRGEDLPIWMTVFTIGQSEAAPANEVVKDDRSMADPATANRLSALKTWFQALATPVSTTLNAQRQRVSKALQHHQSSSQPSEEALIPTGQSAKYLVASVTIGAFLLGGVIAVIANSSRESSLKQRLSAAEFSEAQANPEQPTTTKLQRTSPALQAEAKTYLNAMNASQQAFYQKNRRFAVTLEELERFASTLKQPTSVSFQSSHYTYKLTLPNKAQSRLTALPKAAGLRSYTAAAILTQPATTQSAIVTALCESTRPSLTPPAMPIVAGSSIQCPLNSSKIL